MAGTAITLTFDPDLIEATIKSTAHSLVGSIRKGNTVILIFQ